MYVHACIHPHPYVFVGSSLVVLHTSSLLCSFVVSLSPFQTLTGIWFLLSPFILSGLCCLAYLRVFALFAVGAAITPHRLHLYFGFSQHSHIRAAFRGRELKSRKDMLPTILLS